ncbi:pentatricopeptide repeat-containing protein At1g71060, mitochondrial [Cryptomeria japonica]|uniref:pentatricopeptide repeat-containing protein At1g71060, mitochondrial n=1 Tax=Cryptomeria japonica TaxID=3369 RepID=UPI0025ACC29E|nr:pentatricopeptide repeat-containing protein At1g71060, mitochondrial [Cryptomeria japonica]XP_057832694.1 pentatricopeptide repeat-containing protein At1g71060, mitochondrial [Cryptomeria japonica]XP_057832695.1 pentatricopeptide repeat-containing protein At1g71060, mitochondrial [Cryptomeria japonica]XP_057832696.1 pentatricopeptide repeat-containing protein At1g71060, mitochondrial [Cryptomeria japonica]XP_057832697.1 pentatricopeptide repeat-containing protein At1g71060, mitochondrial [Cr
MNVRNRLLQRTMVECLWQAPVLSVLPSSAVLWDSLVQFSVRVFSGFAANRLGDREAHVRQDTKDRGNCSVSSNKFFENSHCSRETLLDVKYDRLNLKDLSQDFLAQIDSLRTVFKDDDIPVPILEAIAQRKGNSFTADLVVHILRSVGNDWESAHRVFQWIGQQHRYRHSLESLDLMIHILGKAHQYQAMWELFEDIKNEAFWSRLKTLELIIQSHMKAGRLKDLVDAFERMKDFDQRSGTAAFNTLVRILCYEKRVEDCQLIFERLKNTYSPNEKTFSILIHGWCEVNRPADAFRILEQMNQEGVQPTLGAYTSLIESLCAKGRKDMAKMLFNQIKSSILSNIKESKDVNKTSGNISTLNELTPALDFAAYNCLITCLCMLGEVDDACEVLERMVRQGFTPYAKTYSCVFEQLCKKRKSKEAFELYNRVSGTVFFPSLKVHDSLLDMFLSTGNVDMAFHIWNDMQEKGYNCGRQSYSVLIDGLCYNGLLIEAFEHFVKMLEKGIVPRYQTYRILRSGFLKIRNMEKFNELEETIKQLDKLGIQLVIHRKQ